MATSLLPTTTDSQSQSTTQSPQSDVQSINTGTQSSSVQPGIDSNQLNGQGGVTLSSPILPTIGLSGNNAAATTSVRSAPAPAHKHHLNPVLLGLPVVLVLFAAVLVWSINRSAKSTL